MLTLIHSPMSRSSRILWLLEELGTGYDIRQVTIRRQDGSGSVDPANPHPAGQVPALIHDETLVSESMAIVLYLTDLHPASEMGRPVGHPQRGAYLTWLFYYCGVMEPAAFARFQGDAAAGSPQAAIFEEMTTRLKATLSQRDHVLEDGPSAVDLLIASVMQYAPQVMPDLQELRDHRDRMVARPAAQRAAGKDGTP